MAKVLFLRSLPLDRDSRSSKMVAEYRKRGHEVTALVWSRGERIDADARTVTCTARGGYGQGLSGIAARIKWVAFVAAWMIRNRNSFDVVHVVDLDTGIMGGPLARLLGKTVIYDAFDHIGAIAGGGAVGALLATVERREIVKAAIAVFPDVVRLDQYGVEPSERIRVIGNIPELSAAAYHVTTRQGAEPIRVVYVGTLEAIHRGLEYLPALCEQYPDSIEVLVGGIGALDDYFRTIDKRLPNLLYVGHQDYSAALNLMAGADCLYGPYLLSATAHRYASPNKAYEHLALGKPLITNTGTPPAVLVSRLGSGFLFDGTLDGLYGLFEGLDRQRCQAAGQRAQAAWRREFAGLRASQLEHFFESFDRVAQVAAA